MSGTPVAEIGANFTANRGEDGAPVVLDGTLPNSPLIFQTDNQPPGPGPRNFDYAFKLDTPFDYDPSPREITFCGN